MATGYPQNVADTSLDAIMIFQRAITEHYMANDAKGWLQLAASHPSGWLMSVEYIKNEDAHRGIPSTACVVSSTDFFRGLFELMRVWIGDTGLARPSRSELEALYREKSHLFK